jgi:hypothetical protein
MNYPHIPDLDDETWWVNLPRQDSQMVTQHLWGAARIAKSVQGAD